MGGNDRMAADARRGVLRILVLMALVASLLPVLARPALGLDCTKILADDPESGSQFGHSVAISDSWLVVGAPEDGIGGSVYVFEPDGSGGWTQHDKLKSPTEAPNQDFGHSVAVSANRIVVGAPDQFLGDGAGSAFVFELVGSVWEEQVLAVDDAAVGDEFGYSVDIDGDRAVVGARSDDDGGPQTGSAYVFDYDGTTWQDTKLNDDDAGFGDRFGYAVGVSSDRVVVGSAHDDVAGVPDQGSISVFDLQAGDWVQSPKQFGVAEAAHWFGTSVDIEGDRIAVGSAGNAASYSGASYVLDLVGGIWDQTLLPASDPADNAEIGESVALSDGRIIAGAWQDDAGAGSAYLYDLDGSWTETDKLIDPDPVPADHFGDGVALGGGHAAVGIPGDEHDITGEQAGSVCVYTGGPDPVPPVAVAGGDVMVDEGSSVVLDGSGSHDPDDPDADLEYSWSPSELVDDPTSSQPMFEATGAAGDDGVFTMTLVVTDEDGLISDPDTVDVTVVNSDPMVEAGTDQNVVDGDTVSLDPATFTDAGSADTHTAEIDWGDDMVEAGTVGVGTVDGSHAYADDGVYTVTVTVTDDDGGVGSDTFEVTVIEGEPPSTGKLIATDGAFGNRFGSSVAISDQRIVVGAPYADGSGSGSGVAYAYEFDPTSGWSETELLPSDGATQDRFGWSVGTSDDVAVVGAFSDDDLGRESGSVYVYRSDGAGGWTETKLTASDGASFNQFGYSVATSEGRIVVGAINGVTGRTATGAVYIFDEDGAGGWTETKLVPSDGTSGDRFGFSVAISGDTIVVGARDDDDQGNQSGSVYIFEPDGAGGWSEAKLVASDGMSRAGFGRSVAVDGDRIVVGRNSSKNLAESSYVFERSGGGLWVETRLAAPDGVRNGFGNSVSVSGDNVAIGAPADRSGGRNSGVVYLFQPDGTGGWSAVKVASTPAVANDRFGHAVAVFDDLVVVGAPQDRSGDGYVCVLQF